MIEDDAVRQWREVAGTSIVTCEHCGGVIAAGQERLITPLDVSSSGAASVITVCPNCWEIIERGQIDPVPAEELDPE